MYSKICINYQILFHIKRDDNEYLMTEYERI